MSCDLVSSKLKYQRASRDWSLLSGRDSESSPQLQSWRGPGLSCPDHLWFCSKHSNVFLNNSPKHHLHVEMSMCASLPTLSLEIHIGVSGTHWLGRCDCWLRLLLLLAASECLRGTPAPVFQPGSMKRMAHQPLPPQLLLPDALPHSSFREKAFLNTFVTSDRKGGYEFTCVIWRIQPVTYLFRLQILTSGETLYPY